MWTGVPQQQNGTWQTHTMDKIWSHLHRY